MLVRWKLADHVKVLGTAEEIAEAQAELAQLNEEAERLIAMELRARRSIRNALIASGLPDPQTCLSTVPEPFDLVPSLDQAWQQSQRDLKLCEQILADQPKFLDMMMAHLNTVRWARFWSNKHPSREWRERFAQAAREGEMQQGYIVEQFKQWEARQC
jgi:hypothetical protein